MYCIYTDRRHEYVIWVHICILYIYIQSIYTIDIYIYNCYCATCIYLCTYTHTRSAHILYTVCIYTLHVLYVQYIYIYTLDTL